MLPKPPKIAPTLISRLLYGVLPAVAVSLCAVSILNYIVARNQLDSEIKSNLQVLVERAGAGVDDFLQQREQDLKTLGESPLIVDYHKNVDYQLTHESQVVQRELEQYLLTFARRTRVYDSVAYVDDRGTIVAGAHGMAPLGAGHKHPSNFTAEHAAKGRSPVFEAEGHRQMYLWLNHSDAEGRLRGRIVLTCNLAHLEAELFQMRVGRSAGAWIIDNSGKAILGNPIAADEAYRREVQLGNAPWRVVMQANGAEVVAPLADLRNFTIFFSCLVAAVVTLALGRGIYRITSPIKELVVGTQQLAAGDLEYRFADPNVREFQTLADAFNRMAERLASRTQELEARVRQLTALRSMESTVLEGKDEETILRACLAAVADGLQLDRIGLYWIDRKAGEIVGRYLHGAEQMGLSEAFYRQRRIPLGGDDILNDIIRQRTSRLVTRPAAAAGVDLRFVQEAGTREFVAAPLCGKEEVFGIITADNYFTRRALSESDQEALMLFASAAALALENVSLVQRLGASESRYRTVLDNSPVAIIGLTVDHRVITWNRGAETIFGYKTREVLDKPLRDILGVTAQGDLARMLVQAAEHGWLKDFELRARNKAGVPLDLSISGGGAEADFWQNEEWAIVVRDITRDRQMQRQLISSEKLTAVGQLIAGIAHELNNPLQAVVGYADLLANHSGMEEGRQELRAIHESATRCRKIIENLLLFVRQGDVSKKPVLVEQVIRASVELLSHKLRKIANVRVQIHMTPGLRVRGNFQQLEQVLINLIGNACDAMNSWRGPREIHLRSVLDGENVLISVSDTGPGIPADVLSRIWEPFFTTKPEGHGTGLGLALCRQILGDHGGDMTVATSPGAGATFTLTLPMIATAEQEQPEQVEAESTAAAASGHELLIVEDDRSVRSLLHDVMVAQKYTVRTAESLAEAQRLAGSRRFDLVITDLNLGDGTGVDLFHSWSQHTDRVRPPFIFLTADLVADDVERLCAREGQRMINKPVHLRELRAVVREALSGAERAKVQA